jgi:hypothetical protein
MKKLSRFVDPIPAPAYAVQLWDRLTFTFGTGGSIYLSVELAVIAGAA